MVRTASSVEHPHDLVDIAAVEGHAVADQQFLDGELVSQSLHLYACES